MKLIVTQLGAGGRIVIPAAFRKALGIEEGDELIVRLDDGELRLLTPRQALENVQRLMDEHVPAERDLVAELLAERRAEAADG